MIFLHKVIEVCYEEGFNSVAYGRNPYFRSQIKEWHAWNAGFVDKHELNQLIFDCSV